MRIIVRVFRNVFCKYCGKHIASVGSGMPINGMCERCYENGGDDE